MYDDRSVVEKESGVVAAGFVLGGGLAVAAVVKGRGWNLMKVWPRGKQVVTY
jgi:hypothetical protein